MGASGLSLGIAAIMATIVVSNLGNSILSPAVPAIKGDFDASAAQVGLVVSGFALGRLIMDLPAGHLADRVSAKVLFIIALLVEGVAALLAIFSNSLTQLILFRTGMGVGSSLMSTVALTLLARVSRPENRGTMLNFYTTSMLLGHAFSPVVGGYMATFFGWRSIFVLCAVTPFLCLPLNLFATSRVAIAQQRGGLKNHHARKGTPGTGAGQANPSLANRVGLAAVFFATFTTFFNRQAMKASLLPLYGSMVLKLDLGTIGMTLTIGSLSTMILNIPSGMVGDRIGKKRLLLPGMLVACAGSLFLLVGENQVVFTIATVLIAMGVLANSMLSGLVADLVPEHLVGRGMGMYRFTADLGVVLGPYVLGAVVDSFGFGAAAILGAAVIMVGMVACQLATPRQTTTAALQGQE